MENYQENHQRYIKVEGKQIPVSDEVYYAYKRPEWREEKQHQRIKDRYGVIFSLEKSMEIGIDVADSFSVEDAVETKMLSRALQAAFDQLSPRDRKIVTMLDIEGMTERQVATKVGLTQRGVWHVRHKTYAKLRVMLQDWCLL